MREKKAFKTSRNINSPMLEIVYNTQLTKLHLLLKMLFLVLLKTWNFLLMIVAVKRIAINVSKTTTLKKSSFCLDKSGFCVARSSYYYLLLDSDILKNLVDLIHKEGGGI